MRRARIKALATVPVRRKNLQDSTNSNTEAAADSNTPDVKCEQNKETSDDVTNKECVEDATQINKYEEYDKQKSTESAENVSSHFNSQSDFNLLKKAEESRQIPNKLDDQTVEETQKEKQEDVIDAKSLIDDTRLENVLEIEQINTVNLNNNILLENIDVNTTKDISTVKSYNKIKLSKKISDNFSNEKKVDDSQGSKLSNTTEQNDRVLQQSVDGSILPGKAISNRICFMRPVPRLDGAGRLHRNSIQGSGASASESEDDGKRIVNVSNRVRNDSICSMQSTKDMLCNTSSISKPSMCKKRRMFVSESARKLAEARREFLLKNDNKVHDKSKLTMYDLIYYNPITNPMPKQETPGKVTKRVSPTSTDEELMDENVDEPTAMPVPQVKVGPNGQLIIDEQSLVIEQTKSTIDRSEIVIDDEHSRGGFYKKRQVRKEWSKWETLKFYKALNIFGTDFLLMQSSFPKRTRQELKLKFKREERINRKLVEKALIYQEFDTELLQQELAIFDENEKRELEGRRKDKKSNSKKEPKLRKRKRRRTSLAARSIGIGDTDDENDTLERRQPITNIEQDSDEKETRNDDTEKVDDCKNNKCKSPNEIQKDAMDFEETHSYEETDSETEVYKPKPTRSGRVPKARKLQAPNINTLDNQFCDRTSNESNPQETESEHRTLDDLRSMIPDMSQIEPGSLVILSKETVENPEKSVLQVYMVNANNDSSNPKASQNITPINLTPELLATVTTRMTEVDSTPVQQD